MILKLNIESTGTQYYDLQVFLGSKLDISLDCEIYNSETEANIVSNQSSSAVSIYSTNSYSVVVVAPTF